MIGPGKYDDLCTYVREKAKVVPLGIAIVIVIGGEKGNGFAMQGPPTATLDLPDILENIAEQIRNDQTRMPT